MGHGRPLEGDGIRDYFAGTLQLLTPGKLQTGQNPVSPLSSGTRPRYPQDECGPAIVRESTPSPMTTRINRLAVPFIVIVFGSLAVGACGLPKGSGPRALTLLRQEVSENRSRWTVLSPA
jgi:hypothetical protein